MKCKIKYLTKTATKPAKSYDSDNCYDVYADENKRIYPHCTEKIKTGIALQPDKGFGFVVKSRSGVSLKGIMVGGGEIDNRYTGEINVILTNASKEIFTIKKGERIAQIRPVKVENVDFGEVEELEESDRGSNGFGSTGK